MRGKRRAHPRSAIAAPSWRASLHEGLERSCRFRLVLDTKLRLAERIRHGPNGLEAPKPASQGAGFGAFVATEQPVLSKRTGRAEGRAEEALSIQGAAPPLCIPGGCSAAPAGQWGSGEATGWVRSNNGARKSRSALCANCSPMPPLRKSKACSAPGIKRRPAGWPDRDRAEASRSA